MHPLEFDPIPGEGKSLLYIDLQVVEQPVSEVLSTLENMGYEPKLKYSQHGQNLYLYAVLRDDDSDSDTLEFTRLTKAIPGRFAVRSAHRPLFAA